LSTTVGIILFLSGAMGGALNSVVGGATFIIFPTLLFAGVPAVSANATSSVVVWPAALASVAAYRQDIVLPRRLLLVLGLASLAGGAVGAWLLLHTPGSAFVHLIPWLLLFASALFSLGGVISAHLGVGGPGVHGSGRTVLGVAAAQFVISIYGGYFGAGMGILMLAAYAVGGVGNIHAMNGLRSALGLLINGVAIAWFILARAVVWRPALVMALGATLTGYSGAAIARRVDPRKVKQLVMGVAWAMTAYFFVKTYHVMK
jgi:uncharacterized protein